MKVYFRDQTRNLNSHLELLMKLPLMPYEKNELREKVTSVEVPSTKSLRDLDLDFLFGYEVFPKRAMSHLTQWHNEGRSIAVGDTIVQHVYVPPISFLSQKIIVGVRIVELIQEHNRQGFRYETIQGHIEKGSASFMIQQEAGLFRFVIHTFSEPNVLIARIVAPIFSRPYQAFLTRLALNNVKSRLASQVAAT